MKIIGLTGGIASGKSTVTQYLLLNGYKVIDCDTLSHELYVDPLYIVQIMSMFGNQILTNKRIDSKKIRNYVFKNPKELQRLNDFTFPLIFKEIQSEVESYQAVNERVIFIDAPTLFESELEKKFKLDDIWLVYVSKKIQISRLIGRTPNIPIEDVENIITSQMPTEKKKSLATILIPNEGTVDELYARIDKEIQKLENREN